MKAGVLAGYPIDQHQGRASYDGQTITRSTRSEIAPSRSPASIGVQRTRCAQGQANSCSSPSCPIEVVTFPKNTWAMCIADINQPPRNDLRGHGDARNGSQIIKALRAAREHVRLRQQPAVDDPGARRPTRCSSRTATSRCRRASPKESSTTDRPAFGGHL